MYLLALAADYDGTLAHDGRVAADTIAALERLKSSGRRLLLVTGRELPELEAVFGELALFDLVVAENGALLFDPATRTERPLAPAPPRALVEALAERGVAPLSSGRAIVATREPHETDVLELIRDLGLELQIVFNKGAVMVLPAGVTKATGLAAALDVLGLSAHNVVGVGDAENDHAFMTACGVGAAVANALPMLKREATIVLEQPRGAGVVELVECILDDESALIAETRHGVSLGRDREGGEVLVAPHADCVLIAGASSIGKSTLATALMERMAERAFEFCVLDPEGDYDGLDTAVGIGDPATAPPIEEAMELLEVAGTNVVVNTQACGIAERPAYFADLLPRLVALRATRGRPQWLVIDEAHHLIPAGRGESGLPRGFRGVVFVTVDVASMAADALRDVTTVVALGDGGAVIESFCEAIGIDAPPCPQSARDGEALYWSVGGSRPPRHVRLHPPRQALGRHVRKYAEGDVGEKDSFRFRGPDGRLNLRAHNLELFVRIADGVDDGTWEHHRQAGDYSRWLRDAIHDDELAGQVAAIEQDDRRDSRQSRADVAAAIEQRYAIRGRRG